MAQGGYGRGELNIHSDIDLLFLYPWKVNPYVETIAEIVIPALWDAGLRSGAAMRNVRECCRAGGARPQGEDGAPRRALPVRRSLAVRRLRRTSSSRRSGRRTSQAFFKEKLKESEERHAKHGDSIYLLQPQLKEGLGGLRDLHTALWMAKVRYRVRSFRELVALGVLTERDVADMDAALDFLWRVRNGDALRRPAPTRITSPSTSRTGSRPRSASAPAGRGSRPSCDGTTPTRRPCIASARR